MFSCFQASRVTLLKDDINIANIGFYFSLQVGSSFLRQETSSWQSCLLFKCLIQNLWITTSQNFKPGRLRDPIRNESLWWWLCDNHTDVSPSVFSLSSPPFRKQRPYSNLSVIVMLPYHQGLERFVLRNKKKKNLTCSQLLTCSIPAGRLALVVVTRREEWSFTHWLPTAFFRDQNSCRFPSGPSPGWI